MLTQSSYDPAKTDKLVRGFENGFDLGYRGPTKVQRKTPNLKLRVGNETILWNKVMKEVKEKRYAGPFLQVPFDDFIQSPIGLVPKDNGANTRLIFHLSYPRDGSSVNSETPEELCTVKYPSFDQAVRMCLQEIQSCNIMNRHSPIYLGKSDMRSAFRNLGMDPTYFKFLVLKARSPFDKKWYYFVDKCLPFGASMSCAVFQEFSNAVAHLVSFRTKKPNINYLDDFLFAAAVRALCDGQIQVFLDICDMINFPVSLDKTFWGNCRMVFLGLLIDTVARMICIPLDKLNKA